jgi:DNA-nicking Smr family endonuclease
VSRRRSGTLSEEDRALWRTVVATVTPLRPPEPEPVQPVGAPIPAPTAGPLAEARPSTKPKRTPALAPLDRRTLRAISRGHAPVEDRIDLHGHSQAAAHDRLLRFLWSVQARDLRLVLVITGKGRGGDDADVFSAGERGVLRRLVPQWLTLPPLRGVVLGFAPAGPGHGGEGAFYVRLRRCRRPSVAG